MASQKSGTRFTLEESGQQLRRFKRNDVGAPGPINYEEKLTALRQQAEALMGTVRALLEHAAADVGKRGDAQPMLIDLEHARKMASQARDALGRAADKSVRLTQADAFHFGLALGCFVLSAAAREVFRG